MQRRSFNWVVALVGIGLAGVVAVSGATALAARSEPSAFELTVEGRWEWNKDDPAYGLPAVLVGTFTSGAPFCGSGTAADVEPPARSLGGSHRYTCSDGSGSLTLAMTNREAVYGGGIGRGEWTIVEGSGRYASLRGKGTYNGEMLDTADSFAAPFRSTLQGFIDAADAVAPTIAIASARAAKLRRPAGAYSIKVALALRDDVEGNTVAYMLRVTQSRAHRLTVLASTEGTTASGSVSTTLRVVPGKRVRTVQLRVSGSDPVGNGVSLVRSLKLPR